MAGLASPDVPAYVCYAVVFFVGLIVARSSVNKLLATNPDHWAFVGAWSLCAAYVILPLVLFWFLDYTGAVRDTSLFAALVVAAGYRQIFAGGVEGITMPGQTPAVWKPFEAWVKRVADRIATRDSQYKARFNERVRSSLATDPTRLDELEHLTFEKSHDAATLGSALAPYRTLPPQPGASGKILDILWEDLRAAEPENYGYLLYRRKLVSWWQYWRWLERGRSKLISGGLAVLFAAALLGGYVWIRSEGSSGFAQWQRAMIAFHQWRFLKPNSSERDRWRSREFLSAQIAGAQARYKPNAELSEAQRQAQLAQTTALLRAIIIPLVVELRYPDITARQADDVTHLLVDCHSPLVESAYMPELVEGLRTRNENVRLLIHRTLQAVRHADYEDGLTHDDELTRWVPAKDDSPSTIDDRIRDWYRWWEAANDDHGVK